jgi:translation initiation factor IF-2
MKLTEEMIRRLREASARGQRVSLQELARQPTPAVGPSRPTDNRLPNRPSGRGTTISDEDEEERSRKKAGGLIGREARQKGRGDRGRDIDEHAVILGPGGKVDIIEEQWGSRRGPRAARLLKARREQQQRHIEGPVAVTLPLTVRAFSEAIGMKLNEVIQRLLKETGRLYAANAVVDFDTAALIALEKNIELIAKQPETKEDLLLRRYREMLENVDPSQLQPRPPIVTIMGHVDHGKTTLLDKIRQMFGLQSNVAASEAGGITQVLRAWSVKREVLVERDGQEVKEERYITFLDTPGHEAFTKMRARGAHVTDIAVIVVAATDGVMPQTVEAINHARAANVKIIVAINKIDLPNANVERTRRQLYQEGLLPDNMGGDVLFVETSAVTGQGVADLLDAIILVAEVEDWKAAPNRPAAGTCLEAYMSADEGVIATLLIQQGTLHRGDIVLCGSAYGRVRAMYNDLGQPIPQAGPSMPVRITGLNRVPNADDPFYVTQDLTEAREIAEAREQKERESSLARFVAPRDLSELTAAQSKAQIAELKVILKADARGSIEAIRKELEKLVHEEIRVRILHAAVGAISESDVQLALTSPRDTLIIGFNVTADDAALKLAEERGVTIREYDIIYKLTEDVKAALEGRLKPMEEIIHLGRAVVRQVFKLGKVGTVAGCYVTSGVIERNARVRVIRNGAVVYPPSDKIATLESLKRFKDDVREVREGFECGLKISGYDDVKVDDVIEAYKVEVRQRTL